MQTTADTLTLGVSDYGHLPDRSVRRSRFSDLPLRRSGSSPRSSVRTIHFDEQASLRAPSVTPTPIPALRSTAPPPAVAWALAMCTSPPSKSALGHSSASGQPAECPRHGLTRSSLRKHMREGWVGSACSSCQRPCDRGQRHDCAASNPASTNRAVQTIVRVQVCTGRVSACRSRSSCSKT